MGSFDNACDIEELKRIKATHVLNCAYECINKTLPPDIKELHLKIYDYEEFELFDFFEKGNDFMNKCKLEGGVVLVHCKYGISRSASLVISYMIKFMGYTTNSAFEFLIQKRKRINPNKGFMKQLLDYEKYIMEEKARLNNEEIQIPQSSSPS